MTMTLGHEEAGADFGIAYAELLVATVDGSGPKKIAWLRGQAEEARLRYLSRLETSEAICIKLDDGYPTDEYADMLHKVVRERRGVQAFVV